MLIACSHFLIFLEIIKINPFAGTAPGQWSDCDGKYEKESGK